MTSFDLASDDGLRAACAGVSNPNTEWRDALAETISFVRGADQRDRADRAFQQRLWEQNRVAAIGQGNIPIDRALNDASFRDWLAGRSMQPLPSSWDERSLFLQMLY